MLHFIGGALISAVYFLNKEEVDNVVLSIFEIIKNGRRNCEQK